MLNQLKAEEEKIVKVQMRRDAVSQWAAEHLKSKMIKYEANHLSFLQSKIDKCRSHNMSLEDMREKVKQVRITFYEATFQPLTAGCIQRGFNVPVHL